MYWFSLPLVYYPTSGGSVFSSRMCHGMKIGLGGLPWTPLSICKSHHPIILPAFCPLNASLAFRLAFVFHYYPHHQYLLRYFDHKCIILVGGALLITPSAMLPFTDSPDTYWKLSFPAFTIGTIGCTTVYSNSK